ncbi:MAG: hypothetical protein HOV68_26105 [Streptomycetaceae bacterium]|nr:hypothetical protein [Streptomycetaceae bacterium]
MAPCPRTTPHRAIWGQTDVNTRTSVLLSASASLLAVVALTACGDDPSDNSREDAATLAQKAAVALRNGEFVKVAGTGGTDDGVPMTFDLCYTMSPQSAAGHISRAGRSADVVQTGGVQYTKGTPGFWAETAGRAADPAYVDAVAKAGTDVWVRDEIGDDNLIAGLVAIRLDGLTKGEVTTFHGRKAVPLTRTEDGATTVYYIAAKGKPQIVGKTESRDGTPSRRELTFEHPSDDCKSAAPPADKVITKEQFAERVGAQG